MNTKKNQTKIYLALSLLALAMIALTGCGPMEVNAAQRDTADIAATEVSAEPTSIPAVTPIPSDADAIRAALAAHFGLDESEFTRFEVNENTGIHARGGVAANDGGGYFLVAKVDGQWVFVDGGQAAPDCVLVASYGFPASMVPECENLAGSPVGSSDEDAIRAALATHFGMDPDEFTRFEVKENTGTHAIGGVAANDSGGYFLVAKVDGEWVFVAGGQAQPDCNLVAQYGFPAGMVPWCPSGGSDMPDCPGEGVLAATYVADITYPDGSQLSPGQSFTKTWRLKNTGTCTWNADYQIVFDSGDPMGGPASQQLTSVHIPPGGTLDISTNLTAPKAPGTYTGYWKLRASNGDIFALTTGSPIWVEIVVVDPSAKSDADAIRAALAAHFGIDESEFTRFEIGENIGTHAKGNVAANDGGGYFLVAKVDGQWVFVAGGQAAPDCALVAQYGFPASMVPWCPTGGSNAPDCPGLGVLMATFIQDVTYPDGSELLPGQSFTKTWRIKNVGTCTWNSEYQLVFDSGATMSGPAFQQLTAVHIPPGSTLDVSLQLTAPVTPGTYRSGWKLRAPNGDIFGLTNGNPIWVEVQVVQ